MKRIFLTLSILLFTAIMVSGQEQDRAIAYQDYQITVNILTRTVKTDKKDSQVVKLWAEWIYHDGEYRDSRIESLQKFEDDRSKIDEWMYFRRTLQLVQYDCGTDKYQSLETIHYSDDGQVLDSYTNRVPEWNYVVPETILESVYNKACHIK